MGWISSGPLGYVLDEYDKATKDLGRAQEDLLKALYDYGRAAARQVQNLQLMGAPNHDTARQWVKDYKRAGILPHRQGPPTKEEYITMRNYSDDDEYIWAKRVMDFNTDNGSPVWAGALLYSMGKIKGKQIERARRKSK